MIQLWPDHSVNAKKQKIGEVPVLILRPKDIAPIPVAVLWIHGGGYATGMKELVYMSRAMNLVKRHGVTVISPGYHLSWQKPYPAAVNECFSALSYIDIHMESLGINRIMIGGESAGGGLCAATCMMARDHGIHVSFQMPLYPMLSNLDTPSSKDNHGKVWNTKKNHLAWKLYLRSDALKQVSAYASASRQTDYHSLPPCYTFVGDGEPFYAETLKYVEDLNNAGVEAHVDVYHTNVHAFDMLYPEQELSKQAVRRFNEAFAHALEVCR